MVRVPSGREAERQSVRLLCSVHTAGRMRDGEEQSEEEPTLGRRSGGKGRHPRHRQDRGRAKTRAGQKQGIDTGRAEAGRRERLSPGEPFPPLAAAAAAPQRGPALPGRWEAGW